MNAHTALAVVSGLFSGFGLALLRSVPSETNFHRQILAAISNVASVVTTVLSLYSAMVFSLLRYYGHSALAHNRYPEWKQATSTGTFKTMFRLAFDGFVLSFFVLLADLFACAVLHHEKLQVTQNFWILYVLPSAVLVLVCSVFGMSTSLIHSAASVIYLPTVPLLDIHGHEHGIYMMDQGADM